MLEKEVKIMEYFTICNNENDIKSFQSPWGKEYFELSAEDIRALLEGKTLAFRGEYGIFIKMEDGGRKLD